MPTGTARGFTCSPHREPFGLPTIGAFAQRCATPPRPSLIVPRPNGAPMLLRNAPTRATGTPQTSTSMPLPAPGMRTSPGALAIRQRGNQRVMKAGASKVTPAGRPFDWKPLGTAIANRSGKLVKFV